LIWDWALLRLGSPRVYQEPDQVLFDLFFWLNTLPRFFRFQSVLMHYL
jgi:hypothetical protein